MAQVTKREFVILDVFTEQRFAGNQLAVVLDGDGLTTEEMQATAREFGFSETSFIMPAENPEHIPIRIFTPTIEMPFAGHPTIGTAIIIAMREHRREFILVERAGLVHVQTELTNKEQGWAKFQPPAPPSHDQQVDADIVAKAVSLPVDALVNDGHLPCAASCGAKFLIVEVRDLASLARARLAHTFDHTLFAHGLDHGVYLFTRETREPAIDIRARMLSPLDGIEEDPATGSAASALAGLLAELDPRPSLRLVWRIMQGYEMGRTSIIDTYVEKSPGETVRVQVAGSAILTMEGQITIPKAG